MAAKSAKVDCNKWSISEGHNFTLPGIERSQIKRYVGLKTHHMMILENSNV